MDDVYARQGFGATLEIAPPIGLLLVDFVNGFADPALFGSLEIQQAIARTAVLLREARARGWPVAYSRVVFAEDGSDANIFGRKVPGLLRLTEHTPESAVVDALAPVAGEFIVRKTTPSAFHSTALAPWLAQRGVRTLVVTGATTSGCVRASAVDAMCAGFVPIVVSDCVGDRADAPHEANLFDLRQKYAEVMPLAELLAGLPPAAAQSTP